jgi:hypothetical protein
MYVRKKRKKKLKLIVLQFALLSQIINKKNKSKKKSKIYIYKFLAASKKFLEEYYIFKENF